MDRFDLDCSHKDPDAGMSMRLILDDLEYIIVT